MLAMSVVANRWMRLYMPRWSTALSFAWHVSADCIPCARIPVCAHVLGSDFRFVDAEFLCSVFVRCYFGYVRCRTKRLDSVVYYRLAAASRGLLEIVLCCIVDATG